MNAQYNVERTDCWALGVTLVNMLSGIYPWKEASTKDKAYLSYLRNPHYLQSTLPISAEANFILQRIFAPHEPDAITLSNLRCLIKGVKSFWMTEEEIATMGAVMTKIQRPYLYGDSDSGSSDEGDERRYEDATDSLEDDSDDSDEHSNGVRSRSLLAIEEGVHGVANNSAQHQSRPEQPSRPTPITPTNLVATTPKQQAQSLLAPPSPIKGTSASSSSKSSTSFLSNTCSFPEYQYPVCRSNS